jgi:hypothetical protein
MKIIAKHPQININSGKTQKYHKIIVIITEMHGIIIFIVVGRIISDSS